MSTLQSISSVLVQRLFGDQFVWKLTVQRLGGLVITKSLASQIYSLILDLCMFFVCREPSNAVHKRQINIYPSSGLQWLAVAVHNRLRRLQPRTIERLLEVMDDILNIF